MTSMEEEEALLAATSTEKHGGGDEEESLVLREIKKQLYLAGPLVVGFLLINAIQMVSLMFVGHLGELALSSASMATSFAGVTGFSLMVIKRALTSLSPEWRAGLDTLCGQAYGAGQHHQLGVYKQRAMLVLALVSVAVAAVWTCTGEILAWCGQDPEIAAGAGSYIRRLIPALFVYGALHCHIRFLQTQNLVLPVMLSSGATALCHPAVCWLMVRRLGLGVNGAALANTVSYLTNLSIMALYVRLSPSCKRSWTGFSAEAFRGIPDFLKLAVPSAFMVCMEWWSFELLVLLSGLLPNPKLETAVLSICLNTNSLAFMAPLALGAAISTRVSNELGAGRPQAARLATRVVMLMALTVGVLEGLVVLLLRNLWGHAYSDEEEVTSYIARMMPVIAVSILLDSQQCVLSGIVRGCGRQKTGAFINLAAYYLVGNPMAFVFAFVCHLRGMGLWFGILCALVVQMLLLLSIILCTNWNQEALKAKDRVFSSNLPLDMTA
ncbi:hypothetical protein EJB05_24192, partial [Eragrostis curvula]